MSAPKPTNAGLPFYRLTKYERGREPITLSDFCSALLMRSASPPHHCCHCREAPMNARDVAQLNGRLAIELRTLRNAGATAADDDLINATRCVANRLFLTLASTVFAQRKWRAALRSEPVTCRSWTMPGCSAMQRNHWIAVGCE